MQSENVITLCRFEMDPPYRPNKVMHLGFCLEGGGGEMVGHGEGGSPSCRSMQVFQVYFFESSCFTCAIRVCGLYMS